ncbi:ubiquitinyl hydrolase [Testicularia cyperi]|uniref:Ubiquitin carboxyl-terminal hydrolase n=1 Tax=Testicularia cyperi TaxID=1882483 RepID=A0A317XZD2_9BASI|nr:ubiquitinyl hydrolase [Testicularia cyperi]
MKRSRSPSPKPTSAAVTRPIGNSESIPINPSQSAFTGLAIPTQITSDMACPHLSAAFAVLAPPRPSQQVHKEECTLCFDDHDGPDGVDVCLLCFNGGCTGNNDRQHSRLHFEKTQHALVVNVKRVPKPKPASTANDTPSAPKKLAIAAETEADKFDIITTPRCLACDAGGLGKELPRTEKLEEVISGILNAMSSAQQSEVKAWEEEIVPCQHTRELVQPGEPIRLEPSGLASCNKCDLTSNLWLCLTCGHLGCGRAQFGGVGGNSHGLTHFEESGHPVSVKQGTITAEGTADIYCYACNDARIDPNLAQHLSHFGINVMDLSKTEKSMTELQIEQNLKFDFNMTGEDGKQLEPVFGPGLTGLRNLGNSCYLASVLQSLFAIPAFQNRYADAYRPHTLACTNAPATCFECQMTKMADGLQSGRYSVPRTPDSDSRNVWSKAAAASSTDTDSAQQQQQPLFQQGIKPSMFKALIGKGHEEFSTMRQQDADEFFKFLVSLIQKENKKVASAQASTPVQDPTNVFGFGLEQRLQCTECKKVRYSTERQDAGLSLPVPIRVKADTAARADAAGKTPAEGVHAPSSSASAEAAAKSGPEKVEYEPVSLTECLDIFTAPEELDYHCPSCQKKVIATKRTLFISFPEVLAVQVRRFQLINWVPQKVAVPIQVPLEPFTLDRYLSPGRQPDEEELPEDEQTTSGTGAGAASGEPDWDAATLSQLTSMGFPELRCKKAILATGMGDAETAMNWLFAHMDDADIDDPVDFSSASTGDCGSAGGGSAAATGPDTSMLEDMGFSADQARKALRLNSSNPEAAVAWLFENPDDPGEPASMDVEHGDSADPSSSSPSTTVMPGSTNLPATYKLKSFISHKGPSVHSGHYVAHVRQPANDHDKEEDQWIFFNDEKVVKAPLSSLPSPATLNADASDTQHTKLDDVGVKGLSQQAYEYFFERA